MKQFFILTGLYALIAAGAVTATAADATSAPGNQSAAVAATGSRAPVETLHATLLAAMKSAKSEGAETRFERIAPVLDRTFDISLMTALSTGSYWRKAPPEAQRAVAEAFRRVSAATYAARFDGWSGQSFETVKVEEGPRGTMLVRTRINRPDKDPVPLSYVVRERNGEWRVVDILLESGISEIAVRRSEYRSVLKDGGMTALADMLNRRADRLLAH